MNYLAHLYLADRTHTSAAGAVLGDFVRGRLDGSYGPAIETGIRLHRWVDSFTDSHGVVRSALRLFEPPLRRYAGILVDLYFDHILALEWEHWHPQPLPAFAAAATAAVRREWPRQAPLPVGRLRGFDRMLLGYRQHAGLRRALRAIDARLSRPSPLPEALPAVLARSQELESAFQDFFPALVAAAVQRH